MYPTSTALAGYIGFFVLDMIIIYTVSFLFFSLEPLIQAYITDKDAPESKSFKESLRTRSWGAKLTEIEKFARQMGSNRLTHSALFQIILIIITYYALTSSTERVGRGLALALYLQTVVDQIRMLMRKESLDSWLWQVNARVNRTLQVEYVGIITLLFIVLLIAAL
jgi:hypothetical protein